MCLNFRSSRNWKKSLREIVIPHITILEGHFPTFVLASLVNVIGSLVTYHKRSIALTVNKHKINTYHARSSLMIVQPKSPKKFWNIFSPSSLFELVSPARGEPYLFYFFARTKTHSGPIFLWKLRDGSRPIFSALEQFLALILIKVSKKYLDVY